MDKSILILGIETSCDETSAAVVKDGRTVLSNAIFSQIKEHAVFGGVVPEIASRKHVEKIIPVVDWAMRQAKLDLRELNAISVTYGPGLVGPLLVGLSAAKGLAYALHKPLIGINHIEAHICANFLAHKELEPPFIALVVSGGHSHIFLVKDYGVFELLGKTRDDAAGEAFDKVARATGLGYPGGPKLDAAARGGNPEAVRLPITRFREGCEVDFSFSGIKTAALNQLNRERLRLELKIADNLPDSYLRDFYASFQKTVVEMLVENTIKAEREYKTGKIVLAGGVAANSLLRSRMWEETENNGETIRFFCPQPELCTDNAAMVASCAFYKYIAGDTAPLTQNAQPGARLMG